MDDLIDKLLIDDTSTKQPEPVDSTSTSCDESWTGGPATTAQCERLATIAAGGQARQYLGKAWTMEEIDSLGEDEVRKLYAHYKA